MQTKSLITGALTLMALLFLSGCGNKEVVEEPVDPGVAVEVQEVTRGSISTENVISGTVVGEKTESVFVALSARCVQVNVEEGDAVRAGDALAVLDLSTFQSNYEIAELSYRTAQQSYTDQSVILDQQVAQAEKHYSDTQALFAIGAASQMEVDNAKLTMDQAKAGRTTALAQLEIAMKNAQTTMNQINDSLKNVGGDGVIRAPIAGTILSLSLAKDSYVSPGMPVAVINSTVDMKVSIAVSESIISKLKVGDEALIRVGAVALECTGTIREVSSSANPATRLYPVSIGIPEGTAGLLGGMFADVSLYTDTREDAVVVPTEAILMGAEGQYVVTLDDQQIAHRVTVETGLIGDGVTEITAGLSGGETLVVVGQFYLSEGGQARIVTAEE